MATMNREFFLTQYRDEVNDHIRRITERLFQLEEHPGSHRQLLEEIFRIAHTLKGSSRMMGYHDVSALAHKMEDLLVEIRDGHLELRVNIIDLLFYCLDTINYLVEGVAKNVKRTADLEQFSRLFADVIAGKEIHVPHLQAQVLKSQQTQPVAAPPKPDDNAEPVEEVEEQQYIRIHTGDLDAILNLVGELIINQHRYEGQWGAYPAMLDVLREHRQRIAELQRVAQDGHGTSAQTAGIRQIADALEQTNSVLIQETKSLFKRVRADGQQMRLAINHLQEQVIGIRMVPAARIFALLPRLVRMTARKLGKKVDVRIEGEETRIDSRIIEEMRDPLIHLALNALHHGIEAPDKRKSYGKNPTGSLTISAHQEGNRIVMTVADDGQGIQTARIRDRALKEGLLSHRDMKTVSEQELFDLLFHPGFSTSETVDDIAGRGFGLDIVRQHVDRVQGEIEVRSQAGRGAEFLLKLPLTLTMMNALLVRLADDVFALPTVAVEKTFDLVPGEIEHLGKTPVVAYNNGLLPIIDLRYLLSAYPYGGQTPVDADARGYLRGDDRKTVIVLQAEERRLGFVVDDLIEEREIVIKHLGSCLKRVKNVAGATTVRGNVVIILFVRDLIRSADLLLEGAAFTPPPVEKETEHAGESASSKRMVPRILLVDDSPNSREVHRSILEDAGYEVLMAEDGSEGLELLRSASIDAVITDIEMPTMDGIAFTYAIKRDETLRHLPVIIVSAKSSVADQQRATEAWAAAYIVKGAFDEQTLLQAVDACLK